MTEIHFNWKATVVLLAVSLSVVLVVEFIPAWLPQSSMPQGQGQQGNQHDQNQTQSVVVLVENVSIAVKYLNGTVENQTGLWLNSTSVTVFDFTAHYFDVTYTVYPYGYFVTSINSAANGWTYWVGGEEPGVASNLYPLQNGSVVEWIQVAS